MKAMKQYYNEIKESFTMKLLIAILLMTVLLFFKTCSLNNFKELAHINITQDSILANYKDINKQLDLIIIQQKNIESTQEDLIRYSLYKDEINSKQQVITNLKKRLLDKKLNK